MSAPTSRRAALALAASVVALLAITLYGTAPLLRCVDSCFIDYFAIHDGQTAHFEMPDTRLNAWILGWVNHGLFTSPTTLFDANAFHPAKNTLAGSEHLLGVALQLLPLQRFASGAVAAHQSALVLSFVLLALNSFCFVRWATGSTFGAVLAGAATAFMPWRFSELGHLQLLSVQWVPLVWLLAARVLTEPERKGSAWGLALVLALQMLSSFYLAYLTLLSTGVIVAALLLALRPARAPILRLAGAFIVPTGLVASTGLPYLQRFSGYRYAEASTTDFASTPGMVLALLEPPLALRADVAGLAPVTYHLPLVVLGFALLAAVGWIAAPIPSRETKAPRDSSGAEPRARRARALAIGLLAACATALLLMLGRRIELGDTTILLPGHFLAQFVPGFSQMRAEFRWGIVIGLAGPALAGFGVAWLEARLRALPDPKRRRRALAVGAALSFLAFALNIHWFQLPARDAWIDAKDVRAAHEALAELPPGPIVEIPWQIHRISTATNGSRYMLASSLHWRPILNGYTGYPPPTYPFVQRIAQALPDPEAIEKLQRLTGLRWLVIHPERLGPAATQLWAAAETSGQLRAVKATPQYRIYEVPAAEWNDSWRAALLRTSAGESTMTGLPRSPIPPLDSPLPLAVRVKPKMRFEHGSGLPYFATVIFRNPSERDWPGLDLHPEGLLGLRYRFLDADGGLLHEDVASLDRDVPAGTPVTAHALIRPPAVEASLTVEFALVQRVGDEAVDLGFRAPRVRVEVSKRPMMPGNRVPGKREAE